MTNYEKMIQKDNLAEIIYKHDIEDFAVCTKSQLRVNGDCPVGEDNICKESCIKCIKAWLESEDK